MTWNIFKILKCFELFLNLEKKVGVVRWNDKYISLNDQVKYTILKIKLYKI